MSILDASESSKRTHSDRLAFCRFPNGEPNPLRPGTGRYPDEIEDPFPPDRKAGPSTKPRSLLSKLTGWITLPLRILVALAHLLGGLFLLLLYQIYMLRITDVLTWRNLCSIGRRRKIQINAAEECGPGVHLVYYSPFSCNPKKFEGENAGEVLRALHADSARGLNDPEFTFDDWWRHQQECWNSFLNVRVPARHAKDAEQTLLDVILSLGAIRPTPPPPPPIQSGKVFTIP
jgi:hypothetical protein